MTSDPADALRWSRDQLPVFYAPKLGYWVVSRYDDIKAGRIPAQRSASAVPPGDAAGARA